MKYLFFIPVLSLICFDALSAGENIASRLKGRIVLQVESLGEAWYVDPVLLERHYLGTPQDAFVIMRKLGLGITAADLEKISSNAPTAHLGKIFLNVEDKGKAYYFHPTEKKLYYLARPSDAFRLMREKGIGIRNADLEKIPRAKGRDVAPGLTVARVIDGDTLTLSDGEKVRLIGINAPESGRPFSREAAERLTVLAAGKVVRLEGDVTDRDQYGRLLRYVYAGDKMINLAMVEDGYANSYSFPPDIKYQERFLEAERKAREGKKGLWASSPFAGSLVISEFHADAQGDDNKNLDDEFVSIRNIGANAISLKGWTIKDAGTNIYDFPEFLLEPEKQVRIVSGGGADSPQVLHWNSRGAIWNNSGDTLYLRDSGGFLVILYSYADQ